MTAARDLDALLRETEPAPPMPWDHAWDEADALSVPADVATSERCAVVPVATDRDCDLRAIEARVRTAFAAAGWGRGERAVVVLLRWRAGRGECPDDYVCGVSEWSPLGERAVRTRAMIAAGATALEAAGAVVAMVRGGA